MKTLIDRNQIFFVFERFPENADPSVLLEIEELKNRGIPLEIVCLYSKTKDNGSESFRDTEGFVPHPDSHSGLSSLQRTLVFWFTRAIAMASIMVTLIKENYRRPAFLARIFLLLPRIAWIASRVKKTGKSILHSQDSALCAPATWMISRLANRPYLLTISDSNGQKNGNGLKSPVSNARGMLTRSKRSKTSILNHFNGELKAPIWLLYQSLRTEEPASVEHRDGQFTILVFCPKDLTNGFDGFVRACSMLLDQRVMFKCVLIGEGPTYHRIESLVLDKSLEHMVSCLGALPENEIMAWMAKSDVMVVPDLTNYNGNSVPTWVLNSMAMRLPIIAARGGVIEEVVKDFVSGILVTPGDAISLASAIHTLYYHPEIRCQLGSRAMQLVQSRFNLANNINLLEEIYRTIGD
ncbi:MAG: glycosyltransferase family 4 protein [bacterium]